MSTYHNRCESERIEKAKQQVLLRKQMKSTTTVEIQRITEYLRSSTPAESVELPRNKRKCGSDPLEISNVEQEEPDVYLP